MLPKFLQTMVTKEEYEAAYKIVLKYRKEQSRKRKYTKYSEKTVYFAQILDGVWRVYQSRKLFLKHPDNHKIEFCKHLAGGYRLKNGRKVYETFAHVKAACIANLKRNNFIL